MAGVVVGAVLVPTSVVVWRARPIDDRVIHAGDAVVAVEGRPYWDFPWDQRVSAGVGFGGTVVLTPDGCVGIKQSYGGRSHVMLAVWPSSTRVHGQGADLEIQGASQRVRIGDVVDGGSEMRRTFQGLTDELPSACVSLAATDFQPGG